LARDLLEDCERHPHEVFARRVSELAAVSSRHARIETTAIYLDVSGEEERALAKRLW